MVSDRQNGLFLFQFNRTLFEIPSDTSFILYPNPIRTGEIITLRTPGDQLSEFTVQVYNQLGQILAEQAVSKASFLTCSAPTTAGIYFIKINFINYLGEADFKVRRLTVAN